MPRGDSSRSQVAQCALALFSRHGVAGTSLQMIADELGVTKAALYYHFRTKDDIVREVLAPAFDGFQELLVEVAAVDEQSRARAVVLGLAKRAVQHRQLYSVVLGDVSAGALRQESPAHVGMFHELRSILAGPGADPVALVRAAVFLSGLVAPAVDPDVAALDDAALERAIVDTGLRLFSPPPAAASQA
ncbi:MAG: TetR/AcrR family transcriptional regulator [Demequina sp.]